MREDKKIVTRTIRHVNLRIPYLNLGAQRERNVSHRVFHSVYRHFSDRIVLASAIRRHTGSASKTVNQVTCVPGRLSAPHDDLGEYNDSSTIWIRDKKRAKTSG